MKCFIITIFISTILMSYGCSDKVMIKCPDNNYMSKKNINTENYYQNRRELPKQGDVLLFPAGFTHTHRGNPPIGGDKYLITSWALIQDEE